MIVCIPSEGRARMCIRSSYVAAQRTDATHFDLSGDSFSLMQVTDEQVYVFPDEAEVTEGQDLTDEILMQKLPLEQFVRVASEEAVPAALGLLLRLAVADGRITDSELLTIQPALEGRLWQPGIEVKVGDVYTYGAFLWRCLQDHTTQGTWTPDAVPALWRKVEIIPEDSARVWAADIDYIAGDEVAYPDENGTLYVCLQAHTSQSGWEPPAVPALWQVKNSTNSTSVDAALVNRDEETENEA